MNIIEDISLLILMGNARELRSRIQQALDEGYDSVQMQQGLLNGMQMVAEKFRSGEIYVADVLMSSRAMQAALTLLENHLPVKDRFHIGKVVLGTVQGDWHDIGKHMVAMMLQNVGFEVIDIGYDAPAERFVDTAQECEADVICMSTLLTTTMPMMKDIIRVLKERGIRKQYIVMVGGAPVNENFAQEIEADIYTADAVECAQAARKAVLVKKGLYEIYESEGGCDGRSSSEKAGLPAGQCGI